MRIAVGCQLALVAALAGCGGGDEGGGASSAPPKDLFRSVPQKTIVAPADKAAPRWEPVTTFTGSGGATRAVKISAGAIQWRVRWTCRGDERLTVTVSPAPRSGPASGAGACPGRGGRSWVATGSRRLRIEASGPWRLVVEQEVDTALREAPLAAMRSTRATVLARGRFYRIERRSRGRATLYRLGDGRLALRMSNFQTDPNTDLFVWASSATRPRTTSTAFKARHVEIAGLKSTLGDQNYLLPRGLDAAQVRSIVIWCEPVRIAYTAARLTR